MFPEKKLALAVIGRAIHDLRSVSKKKKEIKSDGETITEIETKDFLKSDSIWHQLVDVHPDQIQKQLED